MNENKVTSLVTPCEKVKISKFKINYQTTLDTNKSE